MSGQLIYIKRLKTIKYFKNIRLAVKTDLRPSGILLIVSFSGMVMAGPTLKSKEFEAAWKPVLNLINQEDTPQKYLVSPATQGIDDDLIGVNGMELATIKKTWREKPESRSTTDKKHLRDLENEFFHKQIQALNEISLRNLEGSVGSHKNLSKDYAAVGTQVLDAVAKNPIANPDNVEDFANGNQIGFCFGRALLVHYLLLKAGVRPEDLVKVFAIGQLEVQKQFWKFHVTIMVRDSKSGFLAIDPLQKKTIEYRKWLEINESYDIKRPLSRIRFYVTDPRKFLPAPGSYSLKQIEDPILKPYFASLIKTFK